MNTKPSLTTKLVETLGTEMFLLDLFPEASVKYKSILMLCPFHNERNPSLAIYKESGRGKCFACGKKTDLVELYAVKNSISINEACKQILKKLGGV